MEGHWVQGASARCSRRPPGCSRAGGPALGGRRDNEGDTLRMHTYVASAGEVSARARVRYNQFPRARAGVARERRTRRRGTHPEALAVLAEGRCRRRTLDGRPARAAATRTIFAREQMGLEAAYEPRIERAERRARPLPATPSRAASAHRQCADRRRRRSPWRPVRVSSLRAGRPRTPAARAGS